MGVEENQSIGTPSSALKRKRKPGADSDEDEDEEEDSDDPADDDEDEEEEELKKSKKVEICDEVKQTCLWMNQSSSFIQQRFVIGGLRTLILGPAKCFKNAKQNINNIITSINVAKYFAP